MILERLVKLLEDYNIASNLPITLDTIFDDLEMDSLDELDVIMNIEEEFDINIEMFNHATSVRELVELIENKQEEKGYD